MFSHPAAPRLYLVNKGERKYPIEAVKVMTKVAKEVEGDKKSMKQINVKMIKIRFLIKALRCKLM